MLRILQVLPRLRRGGSQAMVMSLYRALNRSKYQFDFIVFTPDHDDYYDEIKELGGNIFHFHKLNGKNLFKVCKEWTEFFVSHPEYKILHSHVRSFASVYIPIAKRYGVTTIIHSHSTSNDAGIEGVIKSILEFPLRYQADYLFACSNEAGKWLYGQKALRRSNYHFIPNAIALNNFLYSEEDRVKIRSRFGLKDEIVVGHVGGFEKPKNHFFIIQCFLYFLKQQPNAKLMLVGDGTFENSIRDSCNEYGISKQVIFAGLQADVSPYLSSMDIFLFPSLWEGLPVSVVEAQASGLVCLLSTTITRDVELSDLITYFPLEEGPEKWADKLNSLIPDKRTATSNNNIERLAAFDCKKTVRYLEDFYSNCIRT